MTPPTDERFYIELLKLLLQVAWSDDELDPREAHALIGAARRWSVPPHELQRLERCLELGEPLPVPNLGLLRQSPEEVLSTVRTLIATDSQVHFAEEEMLGPVREMLGLPPA